MNLLDFTNGEILLKTTKITQSDIISFSELTKDRNKIHIDYDYGKKTLFASSVAHGLFTLSILFGQMFEQGLFDMHTVILSEIDKLKFLSPVFPGDSIYGKLNPIESYPSKTGKGTYLLVKVTGIVRNRSDREFVTLETKFLILKSNITENIL